LPVSLFWEFSGEFVEAHSFLGAEGLRERLWTDARGRGAVAPDQEGAAAARR
jgi:hypothetical protein